MTYKIIILGAAGDGCVVASTLQRGTAGGVQTLSGFLDDAKPVGDFVQGIAVLGRLDEWHALHGEHLFVSALHKVKQMPLRIERILSLGIPRVRWTNVIDPTTRIASDALLGVGVYIGPNVVIQPGVRIGDHVSIRAGANIGHDAHIGAYCYVGPNSTLCGNSSMEIGAHLGPNACIVDGQQIGEFSVVGACSAVTKFLPPFAVYFGVPAVRVFSLPRYKS